MYFASSSSTVSFLLSAFPTNSQKFQYIDEDRPKFRCLDIYFPVHNILQHGVLVSYEVDHLMHVLAFKFSLTEVCCRPVVL